MEAWQENLAERQQLIRMAGQALLKLHDTWSQMKPLKMSLI